MRAEHHPCVYLSQDTCCSARSASATSTSSWGDTGEEESVLETFLLPKRVTQDS